MSVLPIAQIGHPVLRERSRELTREELGTPAMQGFIDDLVETMRAANGAGLAAPQVERPLRICAIEVHQNPRYPYFPEIPLTILVNPTIRALSEETFESYEGCLSVPGLRGVVRRHTDVEVTSLDRAGLAETRRWRGLHACVLQHEIDHLDGRLFVDALTDPRTLTTLADFERFHRTPYLARIAALIDRATD